MIVRGKQTKLNRISKMKPFCFSMEQKRYTVKILELRETQSGTVKK